MTLPDWLSPTPPLQHRRTLVVTGSGGLGLQVAHELIRACGHVILAGRDPVKGEAAVEGLRRALPHADVEFERLDLTSLASVRAFGARLRTRCPKVDVLINNAGVMTPPQRRLSTDGHELQFATNHLGHFALTAELMPLLLKGSEPRVVAVSSIAARQGCIDFENLQAERHYHPMRAYSQSKLACLMFALELQRRSDAAGWGLRSVAAHPGIARTELLLNGAGGWSLPGLARRCLWFLFQPVAQGALPLLHAATSPQAHGGGYYGPAGWRELRGLPGPAAVPAQAVVPEQASRLWQVSERLTGAVFPTGNPARPRDAGPWR